MRFGALCRSKRLELRIEVRDVAIRTNLPITSIISIEAGKKQPNIGTAVRLIQALKITPEDMDALYGGLWPKKEESNAQGDDHEQKIPWYQRDNS